MSNIQTGAERMPHDLSHLGFLAGQIGRLITISTTPVIAGDSFEMDAVFFFSSRRRHTRLTCDSSSDVCSSDLMLIVLRRIGALLGLRSEEDGFSIGAGVTLAELVQSPVVRRDAAGLWQAAAQVATPLLRNKIGRASCRERGEVPGDGRARYKRC